MSNIKDVCCKLVYWSHWHTWRGGRTYVRTIDDVMAIKPKFLGDVAADPKITISRIDGSPYFLNYGAPPRADLRCNYTVM